jgi:hypothetical protein
MNNTKRPATNRIGRWDSRHALAWCVSLAGACALAASLQAQTNYNFNTGTNIGWANWLPDEYFSADTNQGTCLPVVTIVTNPVSAGNYAVYMESSVAIAAQGGLPNVTIPAMGTYFTNAPLLADFTMTGEIFNWSNSQAQVIGIAARVQLPLPAVNQLGEGNPTPGVSGYALAFVNRRSAWNWRNDRGSASGSPGNDELRILDTGMPGGEFLQRTGHEGAFNVDYYYPAGQSVPGVSYTPDNTNGHYRLIFTASGTELTGQIVDVSTGLPMTFVSFGSITNMLWPEAAVWPITNTLAGSYGFLCNLDDTPTPPGVGGSGIWASYDNLAIVPGVVSLESAAAANGPYAQDTSAGIEVYPQRITVPANGDARFYRIKWTGRAAGLKTSITSIALSGNNVVLTYQ